MNRPPSKITIGGTKMEVQYDDELGGHGEYFPDLGLIKVDGQWKNDLKMRNSVLAHEGIHAVFHLSGVSYSGFKDDADGEEGATRALEALLFPFLRELWKEELRAEIKQEEKISRARKAAKKRSAPKKKVKKGNSR